MRTPLLLALVVVCAAGCSWYASTLEEKPAAAPVDTTALEYEVYSMLLSKWGVSGKSSVVLSAETVDATGPDPFDETAKSLKLKLRGQTPPISISKELIDSYRGRMGQDIVLDESRLGVSDLRTITAQQIEQYRTGSDDAWKAFRERYGAQASIVTFSRVGFDRGGSRALLTLSRSCGKLCGSNVFILLEKSEGRWQDIARVRIWVE